MLGLPQCQLYFPCAVQVSLWFTRSITGTQIEARLRRGDSEIAIGVARPLQMRGISGPVRLVVYGYEAFNGLSFISLTARYKLSPRK